MATFDPIFAADPNNPELIAAEASITIFDPDDTSMTPITLADPTGSPLPNPMVVNDKGWGPAFKTLDEDNLFRVGWSGAGFTGFFTSYESMRDAALAAKDAAAASESAAAASAALAQEPTDGQVDEGIVRADIPAQVAAAVPALVASQVPPLVIDAIAADGTVAAAAATAATAAAAPAVTTALDTSLRIPRDILVDGSTMLEGVADGSGRISRGTMPDGTQYIKKAQIGPATGDTLEGFASDNAAWTPLVDAAGRLPEIYLDKDGRIPQSMIDKIAARISGVTSGKPKDLAICIGQSNSLASDLYPVAITDADTRVRLWNSATSTFDVHPVSGSEYLGWSFARSYARNRLAPEREVVVVATGAGSTGFTSTSLASPPAGYHTQPGGTWDRTLTSDPVNRYLITKNAAIAALAAAPAGSRIVAVLWSQGEEDRDLTEAAYAAKLDDLITQLRIDLAIPTLPFIIGSMTPEITIGVPVSYAVNFALLDTPRRVQYTTFAPGPAGMAKQAEVIHWSAAGQTYRGAMFEKALDRARLNRADNKPLPPLNLTVARSGNTAYIKWEPPHSRVTAYTVEVSIAGGAWTALTLLAPIITETTTTAASGSTLKVRATATNELGTSAPTQEVNA